MLPTWKMANETLPTNCQDSPFQFFSRSSSINRLGKYVRNIKNDSNPKSHKKRKLPNKFTLEIYIEEDSVGPGVMGRLYNNVPHFQISF